MSQGGFATRSNGSASAGGVGKYFAAAIFFPMLWLRGLVVALGRAISGLCTLSGVVAAAISVCTRYHFWMMAGCLILAGFLSFMFRQLYDFILLRLNPTRRTLFFYQ
jgi:hypothetical protein